MSNTTNLLLAQQFFSEVFGAICFYNDVADGFAEYGDGKKLETLAVYFPNKLDLYDDETKFRLSKKAGKNFYERYCGSIGKMVCGLMSSKLLVAYYLNGTVLGICNYMYGGLKGGCNFIFDYFCGVDLSELTDGVSCFSETVQTNNGLKITKGNDIQETLEEFLYSDHFSPFAKSEFFRLKKKSKYYPVAEKREMMKNILAAFPHRTEYFSELAERRSQKFQQLFTKLTKEEFVAFKEDMGITSSGLKEET